ncbi:MULTISPECIES: enoyl-CoA hydratase-related protein [unclassified Frankia]|uniref:enoyl-CoA hydratase-related protein n=1 Tax=unclassified Frankia TaxID=2632575 RepID=UPI001EF59B99|nr:MULTISPECIES: enoyl-CoA hydratase-related protein [unclassified Frankia]
MADLTRDGEVFVLDLGDGENRFNPGSIGELNQLLDEVVAAPGPKALVTSARGRIWSNGLDLAWMVGNLGEVDQFLVQVHELFARVLSLPLPTVAALQGHTFAAGAMLALAHDQQVMRADRGYFCLPEVDIDFSFTIGMTELLKARLPVRAAHEAMTTGRRYGGHDALAIGIIDAVADEGKVLPAAVDAARALAGKPAGTLGAIKSRLYADVLAALRIPERIVMPGSAPPTQR